MQPNRIPLLVPTLPDAQALLPYLHRIDASHWYSNFGPLVREFEGEISATLSVAGGDKLHVTTVSNATLGLELALDALNLPAGSRVLVPALTFVATATAVHRAGHTAIAADVDESTWLLTPEVAKAMVGSANVAAVIPVATFGMPVDPVAWDRFAETTGIPVIIDAAAAFGNQLTIGKAQTVFSLHATKPLSSGEGGIVASTDGIAIQRIRRAANFGINLGNQPDVPIGSVAESGTNAKMSEYHAAVGLASLANWQSTSRGRRELAKAYLDKLGDLGLRSKVAIQRGSESIVRATMCVAFDQSRVCELVSHRLESVGVEVRRWYRPLIPDHPAFAMANRVAKIGVARDLSGRILGLPFFPGLGYSQIEYICAEIKTAVSQS